MRKIIEVENIDNFNFWVNTFKTREKSYLRKTLLRLKKSVSIFETMQENSDKIKAINFILNG